MKTEHQKLSDTEQHPFYSFIRGLVILGLMSGVIWLASGPFKNSMPKMNAPASSPTGTTVPTPKATSPLLFGTNIKLSNQQGKTLSGAAVSAQLKQSPARIVRLPASSVRKDLLIAIKSLGIIPLVVLYGPLVPQAHEKNIDILLLMQEVFGENATVYYELGNEEDLLGVGAERYTASWNFSIPTFKELALEARFLGPVTYQYDENYLSSFLRHANPLPDAVSWHEYTCDNNWSREDCLHRITDWGEHLRKARAVMQTVLGKELPIVISEWYYAPNARTDDNKGQDSGFLTAWTTQALQILINNRVFASMLCACTGNITALQNTDGQLSVQGVTFRYLYTLHVHNERQPGPTPGKQQAYTSTTRSLAHFYQSGRKNILSEQWRKNTYYV